MMNELQSYRNFWKEYTRLGDIISLLHWDSEVMMPDDGRAERAEQISQLSSLSHKMFTGDESKRQIENIKNLIAKNPPEAAPLRRELEILERDRNRAITLPIELVERFSKAYKSRSWNLG
jgi:carboxypeptidase Taq